MPILPDFRTRRGQHPTILPRAGLVLLLLTLSSCATQRYGRMSPVSAVERQELTCREIRIEKAKSSEFLASVRQQRSDTNGAHVLGFLGDFGIGNVMEGNEAEASALSRLDQLSNLEAAKDCLNTSSP